MKKIISIPLITILILLLVFNLIIIIKANIHPNKVPGILGYKPFIVLSGSMESEIQVGDLVIVKEVNPEDLKENDIIAFRNSQNTVTTHRILNIIEENGEKLFETKGDNNNVKDSELVAIDDVEGKYHSRIPNLGNIVMFLQKPTALYIMTLSVLFVGIIIIFAQHNNELKKQNEQYRKGFEEIREKQEEKDTGRHMKK